MTAHTCELCGHTGPDVALFEDWQSESWCGEVQHWATMCIDESACQHRQQARQAIRAYMAQQHTQPTTLAACQL